MKTTRLALIDKTLLNCCWNCICWNSEAVDYRDAQQDRAGRKIVSDWLSYAWKSSTKCDLP